MGTIPVAARAVSGPARGILRGERAGIRARVSPLASQNDTHHVQEYKYVIINLKYTYNNICSPGTTPVHESSARLYMKTAENRLLLHCALFRKRLPEVIE